jgi:hypothetical protein
MKKLSAFGIIAMFLSLMIVTGLQAAVPGPGGPYVSAFRVQNLSNSTLANCSYEFFNNAGTSAYSSSITQINPGDSMFVYLPNVSGLNSGTYSGVVSCDQPVGAVVNFTDNTRGASHNGISAPGATWYIPGIYNNYYNYYSNIVVQNTTTAPVNITVDIFSPGSTSPVDTQTANAVPVNASVSFEQEGRAALSANIPYSAKITASGAVAPVVNIYGKGSFANQLFSYNPFTTGSNKMYAPILMKNYYGYNSALVVQNVGTAATDVQITYTNGNNHSQNVAAGSSWSVYIPTQAPGTLPSGPSGLFGATVESLGGQPIVVLVNESNNYNRAASFIGFASGSSEVRLPVLEKRYFNYNSSVTCQVISGGPATMTMDYIDSTGSRGTAISPSKGNGETHLFYQPSQGSLPDNWLGSGKVTSAAQVACVVNQDMNEASQATTNMDQLFAYEGIAN